MTKKQTKIFDLVLLALFISIMLVMNFTPLGYITTGLFSITLMTIPVALGAVCTGVGGGAVLGFVFGLTSFLQAFGIGYMIDPSAAALFNEKPLAYTVTCFVPRILTGVIAGLVFDIFKKRGKTGIVSIAISSALVPVLNTALFMTFYILLYRDTVLAGKSFMAVFLTALTLNFFIEFSVTLIAGTGINKAIYFFVKRLRKSE
ncbi:MAG: ECF transporter S component [Clostridia bacterium]|nr:ECF transporter S component [Oscillospiraceae bacterium]MBP3599944.1 ECF transporter S component [Clostridia bacterium]